MDRNDARRRPDDRRHDGDERERARREAKRNALIADLSHRLRRVCEHLTEAEFAGLVADMADTQLRFASIERGSWPAARNKPPADPPPDSPPPAP